MTENEAIKILKKDSCYECTRGTDSPFNCEYGACRVAKATRVAIKALEEVQQYRAIGTVEECRAAIALRDYPTAYDADKVVEQLEAYSNADEAERLGTMPVVELADAIKIVKGGGVDAKTDS